MLPLKALETFKIGDMLQIVLPDGVCRFGSTTPNKVDWRTPIGVAARFVQEGEVLAYDCDKNTTDIMVSAPVGSNFSLT
jgi:hypothetical protein